MNTGVILPIRKKTKFYVKMHHGCECEVSEIISPLADHTTCIVSSQLNPNMTGLWGHKVRKTSCVALETQIYCE